MQPGWINFEDQSLKSVTIKQWVAGICVLWENGLLEKAKFSGDSTRKGSIGIFRKVPFKGQESLL